MNPLHIAGIVIVCLFFLAPVPFMVWVFARLIKQRRAFEREYRKTSERIERSRGMGQPPAR